MIRQPLQREEGIVGLDDDITLLRVREDGVCLDELLWELVVQPFQDERADT